MVQYSAPPLMLAVLVAGTPWLRLRPPSAPAPSLFGFRRIHMIPPLKLNVAVPLFARPTPNQPLSTTVPPRVGKKQVEGLPLAISMPPRNLDRPLCITNLPVALAALGMLATSRSEERRVGKECRSR